MHGSSRKIAHFQAGKEEHTQVSTNITSGMRTPHAQHPRPTHHTILNKIPHECSCLPSYPAAAHMVAGLPPLPIIASQQIQPLRRGLMLSCMPLTLGAMGLDLDIGGAARRELSLWQQELQLYQRQFGSFVQDSLPDELRSKLSAKGKQSTGTSRPTLDWRVAEVLLQAPLQAAIALGVDEVRYHQHFAQLYTRELPYFRAAQACGSCGELDSGGATAPGLGSSTHLSDPAWFDFLVYISFKALAQQVPAGERDTQPSVYEFLHPASSVPGDEANTTATSSPKALPGSQPGKPTMPRIKSVMGQSILAAFAAEAAAKAQPEGSLLSSPSQNLDIVRLGIRALLQRFVASGFAASVRIVQAGLSQDEFENHEVWDIGEPAFIKYWVTQPADLRSAAALRAEDGFCPDFMSSTIGAYLDSCSIDAYHTQRLPSLMKPDLVAEQFTMRRRRSLGAISTSNRVSPVGVPTQEEAILLASFPSFKLDLCPNGEPLGCF